LNEESECLSKKDPDFYSSQDLFVGATVIFNGHTFLLTEADDYVFDFMERYDEREKVGLKFLSYN